MREDRQFEAVYQENARLVLRYLRSIGCPMQDAEDVMQETFVKALLNIDTFRGDCKISVWLCQIARNTWYDLLKRQRREVPNDEVECFATRMHDGLEWVDLFQSLREPYRSVFTCKTFGNWSYAELAARYGKTESWARVTYLRARLQMQRLLNQQSEEGTT